MGGWLATVAEIHRSKEGPEEEFDSSGQRLGVVLMIVEWFIQSERSLMLRLLLLLNTIRNL